MTDDPGRGRDARIGHPKNDRCLGRLSKASCECLYSKMLPGGAMTRHIAGLASTSKSLAQTNKSRDVDDAT